MSFLPRAGREDLLKIEARIAALHKVPARARAFRDEAQATMRQARRLLERWFPPWVQREELNDLDEVTRSLEMITKDLTNLCAQSERLEAEIALGPGDMAASGSDLAEWLDQRYTAWKNELARIPLSVRDWNQLKESEANFRMLRQNVNQTVAACYRLKVANELIQDLGPESMDVAELKAQMPELQRELFSEGPSKGWSARLEEVIEPVRAIAERREHAPKGLATASRNLSDASDWADVIGEFDEEIDDLQETYTHSSGRWHREGGADEMEGLAGKTAELVRTMADRAGQVRDTRFRELEHQVLTLIEARVQERNLEDRLRDLGASRREVQDPFEHAEWTERAEDLYRRFQAEAKNSEAALAEALFGQLRDAKAKLGAMTKRWLSTEHRETAQRLDDEIGSLSSPTTTGEIATVLAAIGSIREIHDALNELDTATGAAVNERSAALTQLMERHSEDLGVSERLPADVADLRSQIKAPNNDPTQNWSLETVDQHIARFERETAAIREDLVRRIETATKREATALDRARQALRSAGIEVELPTVRVFTDEMPSTEAAKILDETKEVLKRVLAQVEDANRQVEERATTAEGNLGELEVEALSAGDRTEVTELISALEGWKASDAEDDISSLLTRSALLRNAEAFLDRLDARNRRLRALSRQLQTDLRSLETEHLRVHSPRLATHVEALVAGIPEPPWRTADVEEQILQAKGLLDALSIHVRRLAAQEVASAVRDLRRMKRDSEQGDKADELLARLEEQGHDDLPSLGLRMELLNVTSSRK